MTRPILRLKRSRPTGRDADPRRTIPLNTARWQRLRASVLAEHPLCAHCFERGRVTIATDVDHADGNPANNARDNLQSLCHECHSTKTMRDRNGSATVYGCDANGMPLDPAHHWNAQIASNQHELDRAPRLAHATAKLTGGSVA